jgi:hypothetical protein
LVRIARRLDAGSTGRSFSGAHWVCRATDRAPRAQKIRRPSSGGGQSVEIFSFERLLSRTSTLWVKAPCRLQRQVAGSG